LVRSQHRSFTIVVLCSHVCGGANFEMPLSQVEVALLTSCKYMSIAVVVLSSNIFAGAHFEEPFLKKLCGQIGKLKSLDFWPRVSLVRKEGAASGSKGH